MPSIFRLFCLPNLRLSLRAFARFSRWRDGPPLEEPHATNLQPKSLPWFAKRQSCPYGLPPRQRMPDRLQQRRDAFTGGRADGVNVDTPFAKRPFEGRQALADVGQVDLVEHHDLAAAGQVRVVQGQFAVGGVEILQRRPLGPFRGAGIQEVHQQARALEVAQEAVAQAGAGVRPLDQTRDVATTKLRSSDRPTVPRLGTKVVNG